MTKTAVENDLICEGCDGPETDGDPMVECIGDTAGPDWHAGCHAGVCTSRACATFNGIGDDVWLEDR